jgi:hypothetical protein
MEKHFNYDTGDMFQITFMLIDHFPDKAIYQ